MMQSQNRLKITALVLLMGTAGIILSACQSGYQSSATQTAPAANTGTNQPAANAVTIQSMAFNPQNLQVKVGQTVTWTNQDQVTHTITSDTGEFDSGNVAPSGTYSFTFAKAGTYHYHCNIHTTMKAQVTVTQ